MSRENDIHAWTKHVAELKDLLGLEPECLEQLRGRAQFFVDEGHLERALMMLEMLGELDRTDSLVTLLTIDTLLALGRSNEAEARVRSLLERNPEEASAIVALAEVQIAGGELAEAAQTLARVIDADPEGMTEAGQRARAVAALAHARVTSTE